MSKAQRALELDGLATEGPWSVDPDDRPDMEWNNHVVMENMPNHTVCFMTHDPKDNSEQEAAAQLIAEYRTLCPELANKLITAIGYLTEIKDHERKTFPYSYRRSESWKIACKALAELEDES